MKMKWGQQNRHETAQQAKHNAQQPLCRAANFSNYPPPRLMKKSPLRFFILPWDVWKNLCKRIDDWVPCTKMGRMCTEAWSNLYPTCFKVWRFEYCNLSLSLVLATNHLNTLVQVLLWSLRWREWLSARMESVRNSYLMWPPHVALQVSVTWTGAERLHSKKQSTYNSRRLMPPSLCGADGHCNLRNHWITAVAYLVVYGQFSRKHWSISKSQRLQGTWGTK